MSYWLIVGQGRRGRVPLVIGWSDSQGILPVFGCEEEALGFLRHTGFGGAWRVREAGAREIISCLQTNAGVSRIALDPPDDQDIRGMLNLVSVEREVFVRSIMGSVEVDPR